MLDELVREHIKQREAGEKAKKNAPKKRRKILGVAVVLLANVFFAGWEMSEFGGGKCPNFGGGKCPPGK